MNASVEDTTHPGDGSQNGADHPFKEWLAIPTVGSVLAVCSGLAFLFLCMILPLVGRAGQAENLEYAWKNYATFLLVLLLTLSLSMLAVYSKILRRREDGSPLPIWSISLSGLLLALLFCLLTGLLSI